MTERFKRLYQLKSELYSNNHAIIVEAGALLLDTETNRVLVQLKLLNLDARIVNAVNVHINAYDSMSEALNTPDHYQMIDLNAAYGTEFGQQKALFLPDNQTRSFDVSIISIAFNDGTVWRSTKEETMLAVPVQETIDSFVKGDNELKKQYHLEINDQADFIPQKIMKYWLCSCGQINADGHTCIRCGTDSEAIQKVADLSYLQRNMKNVLKRKRKKKKSDCELRLKEKLRLIEKEQRR